MRKRADTADIELKDQRANEDDTIAVAARYGVSEKKPERSCTQLKKETTSKSLPKSHQKKCKQRKRSM